MIKKSIKVAVIALGILAVTTSCSKDDEVVSKPKPVKEIAIFTENFETYPLKTFTNDDEKKTPIKKGKSTCGRAGVGTAKEHNSEKVDYKENENKGKFLALNPKACGGATGTTVVYNKEIDITKLTNISGRPLQVKFKYYETSTIGWGKDVEIFKITIKDEADEWVIQSEINKKDKWTEVTLDFPKKINNKITSIKIEMGGGEAFAIDDFRIAYKQ